MARASFALDSQNQPEENTDKYSYFQMWEPFRQSLVEQHRFYIEQGKKKLLSQFENMEQEAMEAAERWLDDHSHRFDPDRHDPGEFEENAYHAGIEYYQLLIELREQTLLSLVAGMFHAWDKQLRSWLLTEIRRWRVGQNVVNKIWSANFEEIEQLLYSLGLAKKDTNYLQRLSACRYVVNVYKHGDGNSLDNLKEKHPEYLRSVLSGHDSADAAWLNHTHLSVSDDQLDEFSSAIVEFWHSIPESIDGNSAETPPWFDNALARDKKKTS